MKLRRGDVITVALPGDYGKPRPAVVIQSNLLDEIFNVVVCQMTSMPVIAAFYRLEVEATPLSGLDHTSYVMVEKIFTTRLIKVGQRIGELTVDQLDRLDGMLAIVIGLDPREQRAA